MFQKATKAQAKARVAIHGPSGSGKTYTALVLARALAGPNGKIAVIDSERGSASKYSDLFEFDCCNLDSFSPEDYVRAIEFADNSGYAVCVIDSLTHAWSGKNGALELVDKAKARNSGNQFTAWRDVTPMHNALVDAMLQSPMHVIATMRVKTEYVMEQNEKGKMAPKKVGLAPVQREGMEYEFDLVCDMNVEHKCMVGKTRCAAIDGEVWTKPKGKDFQPFIDWLSDGVAPAAKPKPVEGAKDVLRRELCEWANIAKDDPAFKGVAGAVCRAASVTPAKTGLSEDQAAAVLAWVRAAREAGKTFDAATKEAA